MLLSYNNNLADFIFVYVYFYYNYLNRWSPVNSIKTILYIVSK